VRVIAVAAGVIGYVLTLVIGTVIGALQVFYSVMVVSLFVPMLATLVMRTPSTSAAYASVIAGILTLVTVSWLTGGRGYGWTTPVLISLVVSSVCFAVVATVPRPHASRP
jgi:SSS family solute:Na+ symporter